MKQPVSKSVLMTMLAMLIGGLAGPVGAVDDPQADLQSAIDAFNRGDLITAMARYRDAANAGLAEAQVRLAYILDQAEDNDAAIKWYRAAAEQGDANGQFGLGQMYAKGEGTEQNYEKAFEYIELAAKADHFRAIRVLSKAYEKGGLGLQADPLSAGKWLIRGAELGDQGAVQRLIATYENGGLGLPANPELVAYWTQRLATEISDND